MQPHPGSQAPHSPDADRLVDSLRGRGIRDPRVLAAIHDVPRDRFVPAGLASLAWEDEALPIGEGQTISQPLVVAMMAEAAELAPDTRVLEIGTGSGYNATVMARLAGDVTTIERLPDLARRAAQRLRALGVRNVRVVVGDGSLGWRAGAPYDAIVVTAAAPTVPAALVEQLADRGRLVIPIGPRGDQDLVRVRRRGAELALERLGPVRFVPLIGAQAWNTEDDRDAGAPA